MAKGIYIGSTRSLPIGYTQVEYIQSSGTQYINTGVIPNQDTRVVADLIFPLPTSNHAVAFGCFNNATPYADYALFAAAGSGYRNDYASSWAVMLTTSINGRYIVDKNKSVQTLGTVSNDAGYASFSVGYPMYLFSRNCGGYADCCASMTLYSCKIYDNGNLVRDFVPCKSSSDVVGLYDIVNGVFYQNIGSGNFIAGAALGDGATLQNNVARKVKNIYVGIETTKEIFNENTLLLLHGDTMTDASGKCANPTFTNATLTNVQSKFGGTSIAFNGSTSYINVKNDAFNFGSGDFTIDWWEYCTGNSATRFAMSINGGCGGICAGGSGNGNALYVSSNYSQGWTMVNGAPAFSTTLNEWVHWAVVRKGTSIKTYRNGVTYWSGTINGSIYWNGAGLTVGSFLYDANHYFDGYIDEFRVSNIARWTSDFTPPTTAYTGESSTVESIARKIKKAYIGIGGVARPCWKCGSNEKELTYYGTTTDLSVPRHSLSAVTVGNYALFGGGTTLPDANGTARVSNVVDAYDASLTRTTPTTLNKQRDTITTTAVGSYALFGGGSGGGGSQVWVDAYNTSLTRTIPTLLSKARYNMAATTVGNYALFGGGYYNASQTTEMLSTVDAYNTSLTRTTPTSLSEAKWLLAATTVGNYALFAGGEISNSRVSTVNAYNTSLTRTTITELSAGRRELSATTVGNYAIFAGGLLAMFNWSAVVDAYDTSLTRTVLDSLSVARSKSASTTIMNYALFGGGNSKTGGSPVIDVYDATLTHTVATELNPAGAYAAASVGNYALFALNASANISTSSIVHVYTVL